MNKFLIKLFIKIKINLFIIRILKNFEIVKKIKLLIFGLIKKAYKQNFCLKL